MKLLSRILWRWRMRKTGDIVVRPGMLTRTITLPPASMAKGRTIRIVNGGNGPLTVVAPGAARVVLSPGERWPPWPFDGSVLSSSTGQDIDKLSGLFAISRLYYDEPCPESSSVFDPDRDGYPELDDHLRQRLIAYHRSHGSDEAP